MAKNRIKIKCDNCKIELERPPSLINPTNFCNKRCHDEFQKGWNNRTKKKIKMVICELCGIEFYRKPCKIEEHIFCGKKCFGLWEKNKIKVICSQCGVEFEKIPAKIKRSENHFCSPDCGNNFKIGKPNPKLSETKKKMFKEGELKIWNEGLPVEQQPGYIHGRNNKPYNKEFHRIRPKILERDNHICQMCLTHKEYLDLAGIWLEVHHIDYDRTNNLPQNLVSLCSKCHHLTKRKIQRESWILFFHSMLAKDYDYKYTEDQKIILEYQEA